VSALVVKDGKLLALDAATSEIISYGLDGSGGERTKLCNCFYPRGMALSNDGNLWVADTGGSKVIKVKVDGTTLATIEGKGEVLGQFVEPAGVWEAADGGLFVADVGNARVQRFDSELKPFKAWAMGTSVARDGNRISGDEKGELVTEFESQAVVRYDPDGKELARWVYLGGSGQAIPSVITPAGEGKYLVLYPTDNRALIFSPGD
jgi:sugar lactone lactonase YvrE